MPKDDLFQDLINLREKMNELFNESINRNQDVGPVGRSAWTPQVDIYETDTAVRLFAEIPGVSKENLEINVHEGVLTLEGVRQLSHGKEGSYHRMERSYGPFKRTFTLPDTVDLERIQAEYRDGVLEISIPKKQQTQAAQPVRKISIKTGE